MRSSALQSNLISVCIVGPEISQGKLSYHAHSPAERWGREVVLAIQWIVTKDIIIQRASEKVLPTSSQWMHACFQREDASQIRLNMILQAGVLIELKRTKMERDHASRYHINKSGFMGFEKLVTWLLQLMGVVPIDPSRKLYLLRTSKAFQSNDLICLQDLERLKGFCETLLDIIMKLNKSLLFWTNGEVRKSPLLHL